MNIHRRQKIIRNMVPKWLKIRLLEAQIEGPGALGGLLGSRSLFGEGSGEVWGGSGTNFGPPWRLKLGQNSMPNQLRIDDENIFGLIPGFESRIQQFWGGFGPLIATLFYTSSSYPVLVKKTVKNRWFL